MTFSEVRPYQFGDDIRRIDWNKTARFQEPFVKVMEEERELTMMLLVDISASMDYGTKTQLKREFVAEICSKFRIFCKQEIMIKLDSFFSQIKYISNSASKRKKACLAMISTILMADYVPTESKIDSAYSEIFTIFT